MTAKKSGSSPNKRRKYDVALKAEALRLADESRSIQAAAVSGHQSQTTLSLAAGVMGDFQRNVGQHLMYKEWFEKNKPEREVYTAVPKATYDGFLSNQEAQRFLKKHEIKMFTYNPESQTLDKWIE